MKIYNRYTNSIIFECDKNNIKLAVEFAINQDANLRGAYLGSAYLRGADLRGANLRGANLGSANLRGANLRGANLRSANLGSANLGSANLRGANLGSANLRGANLNVKIPPINDHYFISEILFKKAKTENQKNFSARIRMELNLCWKDLYALAKKMKVIIWATETLSIWSEYEEKIKQLKEENKKWSK